ncbi:transglutaminase domain-containing protein [uncultured Tenacibaculum sp.]|uniref:transglutaminase domain-containing protein n=1 Tax=uncultured Tenacibaculum sp. TaxID=174713 RepID=UPI00261518A1|nr:transglutaminase domain-containing protein [uncultured Tenacibaculum sp.]
MKKYTLLLLLFPFIISAQDFTMVDNVVRSAYKNVTSIENLAKRIDYDFKTDVEKTRAVFTWLTHNVRYQEHYSKLLKEPEFLVYFSEDHLKRIIKTKQEKKIKEAFEDRTAVCEGFSLLFKRICDLMNLENELIYGYTKPSGDYVGILATTKNHVWNAVKVNNKWIIIDPTYGAGQSYNGVWIREFNPTFFNTSMSILNRTHFPSETKWLNFQKQQKLEKFCSEPVVRNAFFKHKVDIVEPKKGVIDVKDNNLIKFKIRGVKNIKSLLYVFTNDGTVRTPKVRNKEGYNDYYFQKPKEDTTLHIYINNELALEYAVKVE